ncbi:hypothetical protein [Brucella anthropi]|uniref:hypothetical protein n=1 Tax=Brucella anthropi TaxID=529 RepID=UPI00124CBE52|nr:hypothetical protein [Brucella anthropi]KAB2751814.1 hypothetical protein F9L05_01380 [Brucella anthropi]
MTKLKYVIEIDTQRVPHQFDDDKNLVVSVKHGQMLLEVLYRADMSWEARRELNQTTSIDIKSVEVLGE